MHRFKSLMISATFLSVLLPGTFAHAEAFKHILSNSGNVLEIEQTYTEDGLSQAKVSINGALLRDFEFTQTLTLVADGKLGGEEDYAVVHHWEGGNACPGSLRIFSLSDAGFYQSADLGKCTETYEVNVINNDGFEVLQIKTYEDGSKSKDTGIWRYFGGNLEQL